MFNPVIHAVYVPDLKVGDHIVDIDWTDFSTKVTKVTSVTHSSSYSIINGHRKEEHERYAGMRYLKNMIEVLKNEEQV